MPPWQRAGVPLIYLEEQLAAIPNIGVCGEFAAVNGELGLTFEWIPNQGFPE